VSAAQLNLGALQLNAPGATDTEAILSGRLAIDAATSCLDLSGATLSVDQRGVARPQGGSCDVGAYERRATDP